jgi:chromosome partitioning protein
MRIIAFMNQKGGVGKTTTTVNLAAALAEAGKKVCMIDLDPQSHLTINYGLNPSPELVSAYQVLVEDHSLLGALQDVGKNLAVLPGSIDLAAAEVELVSVPGREALLKKKIEAAHLEFDFIVLDCPPSLGLLTINALAVAQEVIIPMQAHFLALQGVGKLLETVALVSRQVNPGLKVSGIVLTMFDAQTKLSNEVVGDLKSFIDEAAGKNLPWSGARVFGSRIRRNIKLAECPSFGQTILQYDGASNGAADYRALAKEVLEMNPSVTVSVNPVVAKTPVAAKTAVSKTPATIPAENPVSQSAPAGAVISAPAIAAPAPVAPAAGVSSASKPDASKPEPRAHASRGGKSETKAVSPV